MDISEFEGVIDTINQGLPFSPIDPSTGDPFPGVEWIVASYNSKSYKAAERLAKNDGLKALQSKKANKISAARLEQGELDLLASLVVSWSGMKEGGVDLPCTPENVKKVLSNAAIGGDLRSQLDDHAADHAAFFKASKKSFQTQ